MAEFLTTTQISAQLEQIIRQSNDKLILVSPYLKINERLRHLLEDRDRYKIDIRVVYGKNELQPAENNWLKSQDFIRSSYCKNLHAKCFLNENEALITSMNLYEFSQVNNEEMGILVRKEDEPALYRQIWDEAQRLIRISVETRTQVEIVEPETESDADVPTVLKEEAKLTKSRSQRSSTRSQSPLTSLGYSTSKSRHERWQILIDSAIPTHGAKEVATMIERFIARAERSDNDYSKALTEWRHDLEKVRQSK